MTDIFLPIAPEDAERVYKALLICGLPEYAAAVKAAHDGPPKPAPRLVLTGIDVVHDSTGYYSPGYAVTPVTIAIPLPVEVRLDVMALSDVNLDPYALAKMIGKTFTPRWQ